MSVGRNPPSDVVSVTPARRLPSATTNSMRWPLGRSNPQDFIVARPVGAAVLLVLHAVAGQAMDDLLKIVGVVNAKSEALNALTPPAIRSNRLRHPSRPVGSVFGLIQHGQAEYSLVPFQGLAEFFDPDSCMIDAVDWHSILLEKIVLCIGNQGCECTSLAEVQLWKEHLRQRAWGSVYVGTASEASPGTSPPGTIGTSLTRPVLTSVLGMTHQLF